MLLRLGPGVAFFLITFLQWTMTIEEVNGERIRDLWDERKMSSVFFSNDFLIGHHQ
jgi:hypothetical protein